MNVPEIAIGISVGALIALGRELGAIRQTRKDVNGVGARVREQKADQIRLLITLLVLTDKRSDREMIARNLME